MLGCLGLELCLQALSAPTLLLNLRPGEGGREGGDEWVWVCAWVPTRNNS